MKKSRLLIVTAIVTFVWPTLAMSHPAPVVIDWIWEHLGGKEQYAKARYVEFTFASEGEGRPASERKHVWDRYTGDYVFEIRDAATGDAQKVYFNVDTKEGVALRNGEVVEGEDAARMIDRAYKYFINDTYWLLVPTKLGDYGVRIKFEGHEGVPEDEEYHKIAFERMMEMAEGKKDEHHHGEDEIKMSKEHYGASIILHLWFDRDVGLTPGDQYWLYVKHDGRIDRWRYRLEGGQEGDYTWSDEKDCGMGITLSTRRTSADGKYTIYFPVVKFSDTMDRSTFTYQG